MNQQDYDLLRDKLVDKRDACIERLENVLGKHRSLMLEEYYVTDEDETPLLNRKGQNIVNYVPSIMWLTEDCIEIEVVFYEKDNDNLFFITDYRSEEYDSRIFHDCTISDCVKIAQEFVDGKISLNGEDTPYEGSK